MLKRIRELLLHQTPFRETDEYYDKLAQRVFPARTRPPSDLCGLYVPCSPLSEPCRYALIRDQLPPSLAHVLGDYEYRLLDKLLYPSSEAPILCLVGDIGSGKSLTVSLLIDAIRAMPISPGGRRRAICHVDLLERRPLAGIDELYDQFVAQINSTLYDVAPSRVGLESEIVQFWPRLVHHDLSCRCEPVRGRIIDAIKHDDLLLFGQATANMPQYIAAYNTLRADREWYFQYLLLLWEQIRQDEGITAPGDALFVVDNIDWQTLELQQQIVTNIVPYAHLSRSPWLLVMRPTTYAVNNVGALLVDVERHEGPAPFAVLDHYLGKFLQQGAKGGDLSTGIPYTDSVTAALERMRELLASRGIVQRFVNSVFGSNKRAALACGQALVKSRRLQSPGRTRISPHVLNRLLVRRGQPYYEYEKNKAVENVFHCGGRVEEYLTKLRMLYYLRACGRDSADVRTLTTHVSRFGIAVEDVLVALNHMLVPVRALVRSDQGGDYSRATLEERGDDVVTLTATGRGYVDHVVFDCDYVSEVVMDCVVDEAAFEVAQLPGVIGRFEAVREFLRIVGELDLLQVKHFMDAVEMVGGGRGRSVYVALYGSSMVAIELMDEIIRATGEIIRALEERAGEEEEEDEEAAAARNGRYIEQFRGVLNAMRANCADMRQRAGNIIGFEVGADRRA